MGLLKPDTLFAGFDSKTLAFSGLCLAFSYLIFSTALQWYRLSHIPGPVLASLTNLWAYGYVKTRKCHTAALALYKDYGVMARVSPKGVAVSDPQTIWRINSARSPYTRTDWYSMMRFNPWGDSVFNELDSTKHDKRKAKLISGFSGKGLMDIENNVDTQIAILVDVLRNRVQEAKGQAVVDIGMMLQYFQVDLITQAGLGTAWGNLTLDKDHYEWLSQGKNFVSSVQASGMVPVFRSILFSPYFLYLFGPDISKGWLGALHDAVEDKVKTDKDGSYGDNMLTEWLKHGLSPNEAEKDLTLLLPAGTETSIYTIRAILLYLMASPSVYQKLKQEIANGIQEGRISSPITNEEAKHLPYLQAVLNEGMRVAPAVTLGFPKKVPPGGDLICGKHVPEGTEVYANFIALMQNREVFGDDVEIFRPERFMDCDAATHAMRTKVLDLNFGFGRWLCLGKVLALMEMNKIFVELLRSFDFQVINLDKPWVRESALTWFVEDFHASVSEHHIG